MDDNEVRKVLGEIDITYPIMFGDESNFWDGVMRLLAEKHVRIQRVLDNMKENVSTCWCKGGECEGYGCSTLKKYIKMLEDGSIDGRQ